MRLEGGGWAAYLGLPDLSVLGERIPMIHQELGRRRARIAGTSGPPLASGRLLFAGQQVRLATWPDPGSRLIQLEGVSTSVNGLLADQCRLSPGPHWLFRIREAGLAAEVRGKFVRPGERYVVLSPDPVAIDKPAWIVPAECATAGVCAYHLEVPTPVEPHHLDDFRSLGLGLVTDVHVRPAGFVPGGWEGEGAAEWLAGEDAVIAVSCTRSLSKCIITVDGHPHLLSWPVEGQEMFVSLTDLEVGTHDVHVSLLPSNVDEPVSEGSLFVAVRAPHSRSPGGSFREGLRLLASPASPTLTELWDGRASLQLVGPPGVPAVVDLALLDGKSACLVRRQLRVVLPLETTGWLTLAARELRRPPETRRVYDDAEAVVITASHPNLGTAQLRCDREFAPLRWAVGGDRNGPSIRLIDNTESEAVEVERFDYATPDRGTQVIMSSGEALRWAPGGLFRAIAPKFEASVILPPAAFESLLAPDSIPSITSGPRSTNEVIRLIELSALWASASLPANPLAEHQRHAVLQAITAQLVSFIAGRRWQRLEERVGRSDTFPLSELQELVGEEEYQRALAAAIRGRAEEWQAVEPEKRSEGFAATLASNQRRGQIKPQDARLAEFLLRLSSEPGSLCRWSDDELLGCIELAIVSPVVVRAARFLVLAVHSLDADERGSSYRGWAWA